MPVRDLGSGRGRKSKFPREGLINEATWRLALAAALLSFAWAVQLVNC